ncbi:MAG TPA: uroporphyrinogen decarboxylase family protein [Terriglobia bacterium]|nr:uroporphyrinogen decarboxylase family protein [Terriglobia bacterium]
MDSRHNIMTALKGGTPDRVPAAEWSVHTRVVEKLGCEDAFDLVDHCGLDGILVSPDETRSWIDRDVFVDEWGVTRRQMGEDDTVPVAAPLVTVADVQRYAPPDPRSEHHFHTLARAVKHFGGKKGIFFKCRDVFSIPRYLRGTTQLLEDTLQEPGLIADLVELSLAHNIPLAREALHRGADVVLLSDDYGYNAGPLFSPAVFERCFREGLARIVEAVHAAGGLVVKHSDGNLMPLLDAIVSTGIDALDPLDPLGGMSVACVRERYPRLSLKGGVPLSTLSCGSPSEVTRAALRCLAESEGRGYILSSSNSITSAVPARNFLAMIEAIDDPKKALDIHPDL